MANGIGSYYVLEADCIETEEFAERADTHGRSPWDHAPQILSILLPVERKDY